MSDEFLKSQPVDTLLNLSFCEYEDQSTKTVFRCSSSSDLPAVAELEWSTNVVFFHHEKLFSPGTSVVPREQQKSWD
jgi:hypothetical protein